VPEARLILYIVKGSDGATKPLPAFDLDLDLAFNCADYYRDYYAEAQTPRLIMLKG
jgi:hypothetical protein